jgi:hypothetical protein
VATTDSVIASFNTNNGLLNWRVVLPPKTVVHHIISGRLPSSSTDIFSLTSVISESEATESHYLLSAWSSEQGALKWQVSLGSKKSSITDLVYDSTRYLITALSGNAIDVATVRGFLLWHWTPLLSEDASISSNSRGGKQLFISQLVVPVKESTMSGDVPSRIAVGCFADITPSGRNDISLYANSNPSSLYLSQSEAKISKCGNTAILSVALPSKLTIQSTAPLSERLPHVTAKIFSAMTDVPVSSLRGAVEMDGNKQYSAKDILFGLTSSSKPKVSVLNLVSNSLTSFDVPVTSVSTTNTDIPSGAGLLMATDSGELLPTVVYCTNAASCESFYVSSKIGTVSKSSMKLNPLSTCGSAGDAILGIQRHASYGSAAMSVSCATTEGGLDVQEETCSADSSCIAAGLTLKVTTSTVKGSDRSDSIVSHSFTVQVPPSASVSHSLLSFLSTELSTLAKGTELSYSLRGLVAFSTGYTALFESEFEVGSSSENGNLMWSRNEGLSRVRQAVVVEDTRKNALHLPGTGDGGDDLNVVPTLTQRILMQLEDMQVSLVRANQIQP